MQFMSKRDRINWNGRMWDWKGRDEWEDGANWFVNLGEMWIFGKCGILFREAISHAIFCSIRLLNLMQNVSSFKIFLKSWNIEHFKVGLTCLEKQCNWDLFFGTVFPACGKVKKVPKNITQQFQMRWTFWSVWKSEVNRFQFSMNFLNERLI